MNPFFQRLLGRWPARRRRVVVALLALAVLVAVFDWTWFRPLIQHVVHERSGRTIRFDKLRIGMTGALEPRIELQGLHVDNAAWAAPRPLIDARLVRFVFSWRSLTDPKLIVTRLVLVDARVDLERSADGLRNWRLMQPLDRGPGRIRVMSLDAVRSELRVVDRSVALEVETRITSLLPGQLLAAAPQQPLSKWLSFEGRLNGQAFAGEAAIGEVLGFADTAAPFGLRGELRSGASRLRVEGLAADVQGLERLDVDLQLHSPDMHELEPLLPRLHWPALPFDGSAQLGKTGDRSRFSRLQAKLGRSDVQGELRIDAAPAAGARPMIHADLRSTAVYIDEIATLLTRAPGDHDPNVRPVPDGVIAWQVGRLVRPGSPWLQGLRVDATLRDAGLAVERFDLGIAGGHVTGALQLDATGAAPMMTLDAHLAGLRVETISMALAGALQGHASLRAQGSSAAALARSLSGSLRATLQKATISRRLDARLALDGGAIFRTLLAGDEKVPVQCAALAIDFERGRGRSRQFAFETERVALGGSGTVDVVGRSLDLLLTPQRKGTALLALDRSIHISGPFAGPQVALADRHDPVVQPRCSALRD